MNRRQLLVSIILVFGLTGCAVSNPHLNISDQWLGEYVVIEIGDKATLDNSNVTFSLEENGRVSGRAGCNTYRGSYTWQDTVLSLGQMATTRKICAGALMEQEHRMLTSFPRVHAATADGMNLILIDENNTPVITVSRSK